MNAGIAHTVGQREDLTGVLVGRRIAIPEKRELDVLAGLLERRGASVLRCPLVAIHDTPDTEAVTDWLEQFSSNPPAWLILMTGEGIRRLLSFVDRHQLGRERFINALRATNILCRGPKPARVLRKIDIKPTLMAAMPTTPGVITSLSNLEITDQRVAVQMYGSDPNPALINYLAHRHTQIETVAPYVYADASASAQVIELISAISDGQLDAVAFTSKAQVSRLFSIARQHQQTRVLTDGLNRLETAAVGPIVVEELAGFGVTASIVPDKRFFMKPLVSEIVNRLTAEPDPAHVGPTRVR